MSRWIETCLLLMILILSAGAQEANEGPTSEKARKTYKEAEEYLHRRMIGSALDDFKKADKQDDGHCIACQRKMIKYGIELGEWKAAEIGAQELLAQAQGSKNIALARYQLGSVYYLEGIQRHKDELFKQAHEEFAKALNAAPNFPDAIFSDGKALAHLHQDDAAKASFTAFVKMRPEGDPERQRALLFMTSPRWRAHAWRPPSRSTCWMDSAFRSTTSKGK